MATTTTNELIIKALESNKLTVTVGKNVKCDLQTNKDFNALINKAYFALYDGAKHMVAYQKSIKVLAESIDKYAQKIETEEDKNGMWAKRLESDKALLEDYQKRYQVYMAQYGETMQEIYADMDIDSIYDGYKADIKAKNFSYPKFNKAMGDYLQSKGAVADYSKAKGLKGFFMSLLATIEESGSKSILKNDFLRAQNGKKFARKLVKGLVQIAISKNAISVNQQVTIYDNSFGNYEDIKAIKTYSKPSTREGYFDVFKAVGLAVPTATTKAELEELWAKNAGRLFIEK